MASFTEIRFPTASELAARPAPSPGGLAGGATASSIDAAKLATTQLPGYMTSMGNIGRNIASETAGEVPEDVLRLLQQQGAEGNVGTGRAGNSAYLRSLGLTSLGLMDQGQKNLESILPTIPGYGMSQNPVFQTSAPLSYEAGIQQQVFGRQDRQQQIAFQEQERALEEAKRAAGGGNMWNGNISWDTQLDPWARKSSY